MVAVFFFALLLVSLGDATASSLTLGNDIISLSFDSDSSSLSSLLDVSSGVDMVLPEDAAALAHIPIWTLQMAEPAGLQTLTSTQRAVTSHTLTSLSSQQTLSLEWTDISVFPSDVSSNQSAYVTVTLDVTLPNDSAMSSWSISVHTQTNSVTPIGLWEAIISVPVSVGSGSNGELFFPSGYGETFTNPAVDTGGSVSGLYPSGNMAMQFVAVSGNPSDAQSSASPSTGVYMATHDPSGSMKGFDYSTLAYSLADPVTQPPHPASREAIKLNREVDRPVSAQRNQMKNRAGAALTILTLTIYAEDAGKELPVGATWTAPYAVTVGLVRNISPSAGRPLWSEAAMIYRDWALSNAPWAAKTTSQRDTLPDWYRSNSLWINTHWQCHDVFNVTGGEPAVVKNMVSQVATLFDLPSVALHWYEWQQGPDPAPSARYKFDTHYPDYFPPRQPTLFKDTIRTLRNDFNVYTIPYINGRIFDIGSDTYLADNGGQYCSQYVITPKLRSSSSVENRANLAPYLEDYGNNATFCVASPFTPYWQETLVDTVAELTNVWDVDGVYIDQIGAASPEECFDPIHGHTLGGGTYWTDGYEAMLSSIQGVMDSNVDGSLPPIVTENNAEVYMDKLQGYLTLTAFKKSLAQSPSGGKINGYPHFSPAFAMVYGGYFVGFGAEWFLTDFEDSDWFCGKLSTMLTAGAQMGWFSLISIIDDPTDSCGDMGVGQAFLDPANRGIVDFVQLLSAERVKVVSYMVDGHLARPVVLQPPADVLTQKVPSKGKPLLDYDAVSSAAWQLEVVDSHTNQKKLSTLIMLVGNVQAVSYSGEIVFDFENYGYGDDVALSLEVLSDAAGAVRPSTSTLHGPVASIPVVVQPRSVVFLTLTPAS